jgi:light-regulated signal transduction histidine kinase (bacteriophytochrome)
MKMNEIQCPLPEGTLCDYRKKTERLEEDLEQFTYLASHDLREPLVGLAGFASLLQRRCLDKLDPDCQHFLEQILEGAKRMEQKLDDLLTFSRVGRSSLQGAFSLGAAVDEARRALVRKIAETEATLNIADDLPIVQGSRSLLAQVFQNLFSNAIKYRKKEQPPEIWIESRQEDESHCIVCVRDNGIGFDMQYKDRIFDVFQRLYTVEQYPGTGIGLAIVKKIVERHGGRIWVQSKPNRGTTFFFTLPTTEL